MSIIIKQLSYFHSNKEVLFQNINFSLPENQKAALIGNNGVGKSTLLRIIAGDLQPSSGEIIYGEKPYFMPQHFGQYNRFSVAQALGIDRKIDALHAILNGNADEQNFATLNDDWTIEEKTKTAFALWNISHIELSQTLDTLSGGEKTKVFLSGIEIYSPTTIVMDEPSNHLDRKSREQLYELIRNLRASILVVSHDRTLLNLLDRVYELERNEIKSYGGNYEFYKQQKEEQSAARKAELSEKEKALRKAKKDIRNENEKQSKRASRGEKHSLKQGVPRIMMKTLKDSAEASSSKLKQVHEDKIDTIAAELKSLRKELPEVKGLKLNIENANLHKGKILITAENINFAYNRHAPLWKEPLSFEIVSGDRIVIGGENGSGKTTLIQLLLGKLAPTKGKLIRNDFDYVYIDQEYSLLENELTLYEQVQKFNERLLEEHELKTLLNRFQFPFDSWSKKIQMLSGGEKMKLIFCCLMISNNAPDVFILDEPTNNLDIRSLEIVASTLKNYEGTILLISHDQYFIDELGIGNVLMC